MCVCVSIVSNVLFTFINNENIFPWEYSWQGLCVVFKHVLNSIYHVLVFC